MNAVAPQLTASQRQIVRLSGMGGMLEFYDFTIYGLFAAYFADDFFPSQNILVSLIASYSIFVVGYIVRPLGGVLFSHIGDEVGRKKVLILTMVLMGASSLGMSLLPNYHQIGMAAPVLMIVFRLIQGLAIGGELPSMIVYVAESMPSRRGYAMGGVFSVTVFGLALGMLINLILVHYLSQEQLNQFGWRIPFALGGVLCFIAYRIRRVLHESVEFTKLRHHRLLPIVTIFKSHTPQIFIGCGLVAMMATPITLVLIYMPTYLLKVVQWPAAQVSHAVLIAGLVSVVACHIMGKLVDKYSLNKLSQLGLSLMVPVAAFAYYLLYCHANLVLILVMLAIIQGALIAIPPIYLSYLFPAEVRLTGVALCYNISFVIFAGVVPLVVTALIEKTGLIYSVPVAMFALVTILSSLALAKARHYLV